MRIFVDDRICNGHGRCYAMVDTLFHADERGHGVATNAELDPSSLAEARIAVDSCPEQAIAIVEDRNPN
jgi:ferredoxin